MSFALNLFFLTLLYLPKVQSKKSAEGQSGDTANFSIISIISILGDLGFGYVFITRLTSLASLRDSPSFMSFMDHVLVIRLLLFAPYLPRGGTDSKSHIASLYPMWILMSAVVFGIGFLAFRLVLQDGQNVFDILTAARSNPPIRALVDDMLIGVVSIGSWIGLGLHQEY